jgi:Na+/H+-dicarboxylate symporter
MKVWLKLLIGSVLGCVLGFLLPCDNQRILDILNWLWQLAIRIGCYAVVPVLFFSAAVSVYELRQDGQFWSLAFRTLIMILASSLVIISLGIIVTLIFQPARIPILVEEQTVANGINVSGAVLSVFPANLFSALGGNGYYLLPACVLAFFLGFGLSSYDRNYSKPVITMLDSLSRVFYHIASFFSEILGLVIIVLAAYWAIRFHAALKASVFLDLIILLGVLSLLLGLVIMPLCLYLLKPKLNPWVALYGFLGPAFAAFFSGNFNFCLPVIFRHVKENMGVRRRANTVTLMLYSAFGRAGSAMVAAVAFIVIIKSYSSLGMTLMDVLSIGIRALIISFLLAQHPGDGAYAALGFLCLGYGRGFEAGYLILKPLAFYLITIGAFLDVMLASFASFALARIGGFQEDRDMKHFI